MNELTRVIHNLIQGSPEWHQFRLEHDGASEAAAMLGLSKKVPRNELLQPWSWQVTGGLERVPGTHDDETLVSHVNGGAGGTWQLRDDMLGFALGTVRVEHNSDFGEAISPAAGFNTGVLWRNPLGNLSLEAKGDFFTNGEVRRSISLNQQWELSRNLGLRLSAQREYSHLATPVNEVMLEVKWYHY